LPNPPKQAKLKPGVSLTLDKSRGQRHLDLTSDDRKAVGDDIRAAEFGWPIGMPLCRPISGRKGLWEIRSDLSDGRIARVFFCAFEGEMILLHGMIKKTQKTPDKDLDVAEKRMKGLKK
jgi:phage-related protein